MHKFDYQSEKIVFSGMSGSGKTTLAHKLIAADRARFKFVYDHKAAEFSRRFNIPPCFDGDGLIDAAAKGGWICFDPVRLFPGQPRAGFEFFCQWVFEICQVLRGRKLLIVDELQKVTDVKREPRELLVVTDTGRTSQIDCYFMSLGWNRLNFAVREQFTQAYVFKQRDRTAIKPLVEQGFNEEEIRALQKGEYIHGNLHTGEFRKGGKAFAP